jgi:outer membrane protein OmpA-like peptidoglycan-associated protein
MTVVRTPLLAALMAVGAGLAATHAACADPVDGLYVGAGAGYDLLQDVTATVDALPGRSGVAANAPMTVQWGGGYSLSGAVGWGFGNGVRLEVEGDYRSVAQSGDGGSGGGRERQFGVMGNALYDIDVDLGWMSPYIGVGLGYQAASWSHVGGTASGIDEGPNPTAIAINQTLGAFAYQVIVGVSFPIDSVPGLAVTAEYRYLNVAGTRDYRAVGSTPSVSAGFPDNATRARVSGDGSHSLMIGLRYAFNGPESAPIERPPPVVPVPAAAPVPVPAPAAVATRTYLVFFDWDSAALTPRAREIIAEAVRNSARVPHTRIEVTGHADRTGTAHYNLLLSLRRAQVVAAELEREGVAKAAIEIHGVGDTQPLVPTAAGVRQPENRRVEIVYH